MTQLLEDLLIVPFIFILMASIAISILSKGVQFRAIPMMFRLLIRPKNNKGQSVNSHETIDPKKALWTAMSTTIGIGNVFGPVIAIGFGGPGSLLGYLLATIFGSATTFTEVKLAMKHRSKREDGTIEGGPMPYLEAIFSRKISMLYAGSGAILLAAWSMAQSNTLCSLIAPLGVPIELSGLILALMVMFVIYHGIQWIAELNAKLVPMMFTIYVASTLFIILSHLDRLPTVIGQIFGSFSSVDSIALGAGTYSIFSAIRWGLARSLQSNEAGVGTSCIPHSLSDSKNQTSQSILAMISVYSNGLICILSGLTLLLSDTWFERGQSFDVKMIMEVFVEHFSGWGQPLLILICFMFGFGTILGNAYNGSRCYDYFVGHRWRLFYIFIVGAGVYLGAVKDLHFVWGSIDYLILPVAIPNVIALLIYSFKNRNLFDLDSK